MSAGTEAKPTERNRACDYCDETTGLLYCRADAAKLCLSCDQEVHATNSLFRKHVRSLLCDGCHSAPASILCDSERSALCHDCDWDRHRATESGHPHSRRPIDGFSGCPSPSELAGILGFDYLGWEKPGEKEDDWLWETAGAVGFDDLFVSGSGEGFRAMGVPPLPKNRNALCGQYKDEMINQLRKLCGADPKSSCFGQDADPIHLHDSLPVGDELHPQCMSGGFDSESEMFSFPSYEENVLDWLKDPFEAVDQVFMPSPMMKSNYSESSEVPDQKLDPGGSVDHGCDGLEPNLVHPIPSRAMPDVVKVPVHEFNSQERDSALCRYKEKRKTRRFDKHIRYESRKVRAESRTRVRGRFAKIDQ